MWGVGAKGEGAIPPQQNRELRFIEAPGLQVVVGPARLQGVGASWDEAQFQDQESLKSQERNDVLGVINFCITIFLSELTDHRASNF